MKISPRPTCFALLCAQELSTLTQTSSLSLSVAGRNNIHRPLPSAPASQTQERDFSTIFSNFQTLLAAFSPTTGTYWQNLWKNLSYGSVGRCLQCCPASASSDPRRSVASLFCAVSGSEAVHSVGRNAAKSSINHLQNSVSKHLSLTDCLDF